MKHIPHYVVYDSDFNVVKKCYRFVEVYNLTKQNSSFRWCSITHPNNAELLKKLIYQGDT